MQIFDEFIDDNLEIINEGAEKNVPGQAYDLAAVYSFLGDENEAMKWVIITLEEGFFPLKLVERDPMFDLLRKNEKFQEIMAQKKLEEEKNKPQTEAIRKKVLEFEQMGILSLELDAKVTK